MIDGNRTLWLHVLQQAFMDATATEKGTLDQRTADRWIRDCGRDFRLVCSLGGMDADFLSGAYRAGRVNPVWLRQDPQRIGQTWHEKNRMTARDSARRRYAERKGAV